MLLRYEELFDGTLGDWNRPPISIELKEGAKPYHGRPYPVAQVHKATLMKEINRLVSIGVLKKQSSSEWASPTFIIPKKDMTVRTISDFRELNKRIVRRPFPIPKISTTLQELEGYRRKKLSSRKYCPQSKLGTTTHKQKNPKTPAF